MQADDAKTLIGKVERDARASGSERPADRTPGRGSAEDRDRRTGLGREDREIEVLGQRVDRGTIRGLLQHEDIGCQRTQDAGQRRSPATPSEADVVRDQAEAHAFGGSRLTYA